MSDYRAKLYHRYVSAFNEQALSEKELHSYFSWCDRKFLPILKQLKKDDEILEIGCGSGNMLQFLKHHEFSKIAGIDVSEEQIQNAKKAGLEAKVADVFDYLEGEEEGKFHAIIALDFIEHFSKDELMRLVSLIWRSLKDGGILIIQTPNGAGLFPRQVIYGDLTHMAVFTTESLQQLLRQFGFSRFMFFETGPVPRDFTSKARLWLWSCIKIAANFIRKIETGKSQDIWTENLICFCRKSSSGVI